MQLVEMAILLLVLGAFAGLMAGLLGVGGGIILVPGYYYAFSYLGYGGADLMQICLATSLATIIVTSIRSLMAHNRKGAVDWTILRGWAPGIVAGAIVGVLVVDHLQTWTLQLIFGVVALVVSAYLGLGRDDWRLGEEMPGRRPRNAFATLVGFLSVLMGIGGGSFGVPLMTLYGTPIHRAVATAAGFGVTIAVPAVLGFLLTQVQGAPPWTIGALNVPAFVVTIAMTLLTAPVGARIAHGMDPKPLKRVFAVFLCIVALNMLRKVLLG